MKPIILWPRYTICLWLLAILCASASAQEDSAGALPPSLVTAEVLEARIAGVETAADEQAETKSKLIALYRKSLSNLEEAKANGQRGALFEGVVKTSLVQIQSIHDETKAAGDEDRPDALDVDLETTLEQIERRLKKVRADLAVSNAQRTDFERKIAFQENRPATIRQRVTAAQEQQTALAATLQVEPTTDETPALIQARRWFLETRYMALSTEIKMLDGELLSQPVRVDLLEAKRDRDAANFARIGRHVNALERLVNEKRGMEAAAASAATRQMLRTTAPLDPILVRLAEQNAELTERLNAIAAKLDALDKEQDLARRAAERIKAQHQRSVASKEIGGVAEGLGQLLLEHRRALPDFQVQHRKARERSRVIADINLRRLLLQEEAVRFVNTDLVVADLASRLPADQASQLDVTLRELIGQRQGLLEKLLEAEGFYLDRLRSLEAAETDMLNAARVYEDFMTEQLFWLATETRSTLADFGRLPQEARALVSPAVWSELSHTFRDQVLRSPEAWFMFLVAAIFLWKRRTLIAAIEATAVHVGKPVNDRFGYTLRALALTLMVSAALPLLLAVPGWQLIVAAQSTDLSQAVGYSLLRVTVALYILLALREMCMPRGLAVAHFRWPTHNVRRLRAEIDWFVWIIVPLSLVGRFAMDVSPIGAVSGITKILTVIIYLGLALFLYRVFHPKSGVLTYRQDANKPAVSSQHRRLWVLVLVGFPPAVIAFGLGGYMYSAGQLLHVYGTSLFLMAGLVVLHALARRWLQVVRRRLALKALEEAEATGEPESAGEESADMEGEFVGVDLDELGEDSQELLKIAVVFTTLTGLYFIWSPVLPAFGILDDVTLWQYTATVNGEAQQLAVTLADLGLALIYAIIVGVLAKRLPALLEMILLARFDMSPGGRYAVTTLTTYAIVTFGALLVFDTIGAQWSQLQWLVAALGIGIGFGLQEIVANFICGLIILFERPIRVGDLITVGDASGTVARIRIRATTIRDFEQKELLVPNKELITGRLLNWTLSDAMTRILIQVGIAYGSDVDRAMEILLELADEDERVLDEPKPGVVFDQFAESSLNLGFRVYVGALEDRLPVMTDMHRIIHRRFAEEGIVIAFPQRDVHIHPGDTQTAMPGGKGSNDDAPT